MPYKENQNNMLITKFAVW